MHSRMYANSTWCSTLMRCVAYRLSVEGPRLLNPAQVHHILAEIIQGGVVLETNLDEIDSSSKSL